MSDLISSVSSGVPERNDRLFVELIVEYPSICTYTEYEGKPYFSIKYIENGKEHIGYGTYKPEVLSQFLKEYFISSTKLERKKGKWIDDTFCSECGWTNEVESGFIGSVKQFNFCPNCEADMRGEEE